LGDLLPGAVRPPLDLGARLPTPLDESPAIGAELGLDFAVKREDLTDDLGCGHKLRKLAHVAADAQAHGASVLVTAGSLPSSQCVAVAAAAQRLGIRAHLVYCGDEQVKPTVPSGSYLLALLLGPTITWHERTPWTEVPTLLADAAAREAAAGAVPYVIPPGLDTWPGIRGSVELGLELADQLSRTAGGADGAHIVAPAGSGATCLGLSVAARLLGLRWTVHGMCIGGTAAGVAANIARLRGEAVRRIGDVVADVAVVVHAGSLGAGYDRPTGAELELMRAMVRRHQLVLDPNYLVKTYRGLLLGLESGVFAAGDRVVLVHTGGSLGLFADSPALTAWYRTALSAGLAPGSTPAAAPPATAPTPSAPVAAPADVVAATVPVYPPAAGPAPRPVPRTTATEGDLS
jgi:1-aminocyclopropane-1-carboxylate deaminase/D-cysteine desulfhydrase-like pyridoxal-dependent ACC family enzyme